jgi:transposase InsO family protein
VIITLQKQKTSLTFDRIFKTGQGFVAGMNLTPRAVRDSAFLGLESKRMTMNAAHSCMTHIGEDATRLTAKHYGLTVSGKLEPCTHCGMAKARQSNISKTTDARSQIKGERLFIDLSWTQEPSYGGTMFWLLVMDDFSGYVLSYFLKNKDAVSETIIELIRNLKHQKTTVRIIRCDNAGEHLTLQDECRALGLGIRFVFTSRNTSQHNGRIERKFQTLY